MGSILKRGLRSVARRLRARPGPKPPTPDDIERKIGVPQPADPSGLVVIAAVNGGNLDGPGKVTALSFLPDFLATLRGRGIATRIVTRLEDAEGVILPGCPAAIIFVYREVACRFATPEARRIQELFDISFNAPELGETIRDKEKTLDLFLRHGVPTPERATGEMAKVFSNDAAASGAAVQVLDGGAPLDPARHNVAFIDTRRSFGGVEYYTTVRLMCLGPHILQAYVRARPTAEGNPSVHAKDTPLDPPLLKHLQADLVDARRDDLEALAGLLGEALGPGFFSHDLLTCRETGEISVCESGFKFPADTYTRHVAPIAEHLPWSGDLFPVEASGRRYAEIFVQLCAGKGINLAR